MADADQLAKLNEGVEAWNQWRKENLQAAIDLSEADLAGKDLTGADLRDANLSGANLRESKLGPGTLLWRANLSDAKLYKADLSGAELQDVKFARADLFYANLREAKLRSADLSLARGGLQTEMLPGTDLTGAILPDHLKKLYDGLENVKSISESARNLFLVVLAACLYCWLTIATTTDVNLITNRASSPLPIIQTSIPIVGFYVVAPLLLLCVYFYFQFYLQKLWEELGFLPAIFPDGRPLHTKVDPWLLNDLVRAHLPMLNANRPFLSYFQLWISVLLAWWVVPATMFLFWGRYLRRHEWIGTTFHVALLVISSVAAICLYRLGVATLRGSERRAFTWKGTLTSRRGYLTAAFALVAGVAFGLLSLGAIQGVRSSKPIFGIRALRTERPIHFWAGSGGVSTWVPRFMGFIGYPPFANLTDAEVSQKKPNWTKNGKDLDSVVGSQLSGANLRYASARGAFLAAANLFQADLRGADLNGADLSGADLESAKLTSANLWLADLRGASLISTDLSDADLSGADLNGAKLTGAHLAGASLRDADLSGADLSRTTLTGDLYDAILAGADLNQSDLSTANLQHADLSRANLTDAALGGADLAYSNLRETKNLDLQRIRSAHYWEKAFYDCKIIEALALPLDNNVQLFQQVQKDQLYEIRRELLRLAGEHPKLEEKQPEPCPSTPTQ
jgi:uncharacterized protein YjbI with pentapeptide repeats